MMLKMICKLVVMLPSQHDDVDDDDVYNDDDGDSFDTDNEDDVTFPAPSRP